ncbi:MAG: alpha/beta fold hydrolase [Phycisphaerales bacterium]|nr:MAG: alpha/beta fold hydrolase [Phycisphaerales bacterium]
MPNFKEISVSLPDKYPAYARFWCPTNLQGAVLFHHGIQSHCGWYESSAASLVEAGFAVLQVDRRGCGRNSTDRGHAESADLLIGDALAARDTLAHLTGFKKHHVIGVSWGGKLAVAAYVSDPDYVLSLTLVTPGLFPLVGVSKGEMSKIGFAMLYEQERLFDIPLNQADLFTTVPRWKHFFDTDVLTLSQCTAGFFLASRRMDKIVAKLPTSRPVPVHLFVAGVERIIDNDKTIAFVRDLNWPDCQITQYNEARHSLEFEGDPAVFFRDQASFIADRRTPCSGKQR